jgi:hypothetical protein
LRAGPGIWSSPSNVGSTGVCPSGAQRMSDGRLSSEQSYCSPVVALVA